MLDDLQQIGAARQERSRKRKFCARGSDPRTGDHPGNCRVRSSVSKIDQYRDLRNGILAVTPMRCSLGRCKLPDAKVKLLHRRRPTVDLNFAVAQLSRVLQIVEAMTHPDCPSLQNPSTLALIRIPSNGHSLSGEKYIMITCPECLRTFPQVLGEFICPIHETGYVHCRSLIHFAMAEPSAEASPPVF